MRRGGGVGIMGLSLFSGWCWSCGWVGGRLGVGVFLVFLFVCLLAYIYMIR